MNDSGVERPSANFEGNRAALRSVPPDDLLCAPVACVKGVGTSRAELLARLGVFRVFDLLFYFPRDYVEISVKRKTGALNGDSVQSIIGVVESVQTFRTRRGVVTKLVVATEDDRASAVWFNLPRIASSFRVGSSVMLTGKPKPNERDGGWEFSHPTTKHLGVDLALPYDVERRETTSGIAEERYVLPVYPLTEGLYQAQLQRYVKNALETLPDRLPEALPDAVLRARSLMPIAEAVRKIHFPVSMKEAAEARRRFAYQELLVLQLALTLCKTRRLANMKAAPLPCTAKIDSRIRALFPFEFTDSQNQAAREIAGDMSRPSPMNRLLQGDVGTGKTAVAIYAALVAVANGAQAVVMAPTEILARQHLRELQERLRGSATRIAPVFGGQKASERKEILDSIKSGQAQIIVGTQALVCNEIEFHRLGLVIIDEQHKFGVRQRAALKSSTDLEPHYLVMTATPIPRSVTLTLFGDLDASIMRDPPPGRLKTTTVLLNERTRASWWQFVRERLDEGRQAYVVVPRLEDDDAEKLDPFDFEGRELRRIENDGSFSSDFDAWNAWEGPTKTVGSRESTAKTDGDDESRARLKNVWSEYRELIDGELKGRSVAVMHGKMTTQEKDDVMRDFKSGKIQVLVSTSVVEVGVDVPNATIMTIENAERFGLAALHQLRGRVSRGSHPGYCAAAPTPGLDAPPKEDKNGKSSASKKSARKKESAQTPEEKRRAEAMERLEYFARVSDGFELAEIDFKLRGPGQIFGSRQHGGAALRVADLVKDFDVVEEATSDAREMIANDPGLAKPEHAALRRQTISRYGATLDLGDVG